ncbi:MAG: GPW/gp25 family protein [Planctomycetes bacterium]|nr:GPW/gp25 family protein [Planctomycetota bacterium]
MAQRRNQDHLQPSLVDRLRLSGPRIIDGARLRESVCEYLQHLFEARLPRMLPHSDPVRSSTVCFGLPDVGSQSAAELIGDPEIDLVGTIERLIDDFEPRLRLIRDDRTRPPVRVVIAEEGQVALPGTLIVEIHGRVWDDPVPFEVLLRSRIDLIDGSASVEPHRPGASAGTS